jgi:hypothetical protein
VAIGLQHRNIKTALVPETVKLAVGIGWPGQGMADDKYIA